MAVDEVARTEISGLKEMINHRFDALDKKVDGLMTPAVRQDGFVIPTRAGVTIVTGIVLGLAALAGYNIPTHAETPSKPVIPTRPDDFGEEAP